MSDSAAILNASGQQQQDPEQLFTQLYNELRRIAARKLRASGGATLSPTTLLHETFLHVSAHAACFSSESHFIAYAARAMRGLIIDHRRHRRAHKRGGNYQITSLPTELPHAQLPDEEMERLNEAIEALARLDARLAQCVELRFFCGFSLTDIAELLQVSERTVRRDWDKARVLLNRIMLSGAPAVDCFANDSGA
jgi:RNA polymerase sigma factor (TIGR02999 family)